MTEMECEYSSSDSEGRQVVIFDLDGTIIDSSASMEASFRAAFSRVHGQQDGVPFEELRKRQGVPFPTICQEMGWSAALPAAFIEESRRRMGSVRVFPGMESILRELSGEGVILALLTGKDRSRSVQILAQFGLHDLFESTVCGDDALPGKPEPAGVRELILRCGSTPDRTTYVGDAPADFWCAQRAGVRFIGVKCGLGSRRCLKAWAAGLPATRQG
ncbi:HAD family hydrolase [Arthrobacter sp. NtRootA1]|uniref:HAD family hydrolase n=1 Tax=Arthrobacter sp. NtRootA1 TaxID=2830983 RepID=UPI001CC4852F|nr:HAD family hydrolase [Arthrobacter sp. NtRootA1]BCW08028.1 hypothetical protein NtRootA1_41660 [Arthrobacter sp. NtRootA1]